jgi:hypothetical protein
MCEVGTRFLNVCINFRPKVVNGYYYWCLRKSRMNFAIKLPGDACLLKYNEKTIFFMQDISHLNTPCSLLSLFVKHF